jgi:hypothetical protein
LVPPHKIFGVKKALWQSFKQEPPQSIPGKGAIDECSGNPKKLYYAVSAGKNPTHVGYYGNERGFGQMGGHLLGVGLSVPGDCHSAPKYYINTLAVTNQALVDFIKKNKLDTWPQEIGRQNGFSFYLLLLITMISQVFHKKKDAASVICILAFMSFITLTFILKFQYAQHYVYPVSFFLLFSVVTLLQKRKQILLLCLILILQIIAFSKSPYSLSPRPYQKFEKVVKIIVQKKFITKNEKVNIIQVRPDTAIASSGHEYRYFFKEAGITLNPVFDYKSANSLLIFSEDPKFELKKLDNWEINEFGKNHKLEIAQIIDSILVLRLTK